MQFVYGVRPDTHEQGWRVFAPVQYGDSIVFVDADFIAGIAGARCRTKCAFPRRLRARRADHRRFGAARTAGAADACRRGRCSGSGSPSISPPWAAMPGSTTSPIITSPATYVGADGRATPNPFALAPGADALPPARHLGYALTWYGLALVLLVDLFRLSCQRRPALFAAPRPRED